jgi:hypothetical protein
MKNRVALSMLFALIVVTLAAACPRLTIAQGTAHATCDSLAPADGSSWDAWAPEYYVYIDLHTSGHVVSITGGFTGVDYIATWHLFLTLNGGTVDGDPLSGAKFRLDNTGFWSRPAKGTGELDAFIQFHPGNYQVGAYTDLSASVFNGVNLNPHPATDTQFHNLTVQARQ